MCSNTFAVVGLLMHDMGLQLKLLGKKSESFKIQSMPKAILAENLQLNVEAVSCLYCAVDGKVYNFIC